MLADEGTFIQASAAEMAGVPDDVRNAAAEVAKAKGLPAGTFAVRNTRSAVDPVLSFASNRALRQKVWTAFVNRGDNGNANDTNALIAKIVKLRADRAHLLGYKTHADLRMQDTMAKTPARAMDLMMRVWPAAVKRVNEEVADMRPFAAQGRREARSSRGIIVITRRRFGKRSTTSAKTRSNPISSCRTWSTACSGRPSNCTI